MTDIMIGKTLISLSGYLHIDKEVKASTESEDGVIEILDKRPLKLYFEDSDYWLELRKDWKG